MFSWRRFVAVMQKEFIQMRRDRLTFAMIVGIPLIQLILFGYAINTNPRHLPTAIVSADHSVFSRQVVRTLSNTSYFKVIYVPKSEADAKRLLAQGKVIFVINVPPDFTQKLVRNQKPQLLIEADGTDPSAIGNAVSAARVVTDTMLKPVIKGPLRNLRTPPPTVDVVSHIAYNPENNTHFFIVPGLLGVVLTMTMVMITSLAITREHERGTMENLLSTPVRPSEVMLGKILPYILVGYIQVLLIMLTGYYLFKVPIEGSVLLLCASALPFIAANLSVGLTFSSLAKTQLQAVQLAFFFFLPSLLLSGFMFPFYGMPEWAQWLGNALPLTHFLHIVRGIMLKGNGFELLWPSIWPILIFMIAALIIGIKQYRQTLD